MEIMLSNNIKNDKKSYVFLIELICKIEQVKEKDIILNLSNTKCINTNLLALLYIAISVAEQHNIYMDFLLPDKVLYKGYDAIYSIFNYYTDGQSRIDFFKPRCVVEDSNIKELENMLTKYILDLKLREVEKIQIILSELIANIKMHVGYNSNCKGYIGACVEDSGNSKKYLYITIANNCKSIKGILLDNKMEFNTDVEAIFWTLKKTNSTRNDKETGGIGLYLLRKFIKQLEGKIIIASGKVIISMDENCYIEENENFIEVKEKINLNAYFNGTIITIIVPYIQTDREKKEVVDSDECVSIIDIEGKK